MVARTEAPTVPPRSLVDAFGEVSPAVLELLRRAGDPTRRVVGSDWTVAQLGAHLVAGLELYCAILRGKGSPYTSWRVTDIAARSQAGIDEVLHRDGDLGDQFQRAFDDWREVISARDLPPTVAYHTGQPVAPLRVAAIMLGEQLVHGYDLATTLGRPWRIDPGHVDLVVRGLCVIMPHCVIAERAHGFTATYQLRLRGQGTYTFRLVNGELTVGGRFDGPVDCRISADPATYLLVGYGRLGPIRPALTGRMVVYGRKPWLGPRFARLVAAP